MKRDGTIGTAGKGALIQTEISATLGVTQDQYLFVPLHGEICPPLDASYYKGCGERNGIEREVVAVRTKSYGIDQYNQSLVEEKVPPLRAARGGDTTPKVLSVKHA